MDGRRRTRLLLETTLAGSAMGYNLGERESLLNINRQKEAEIMKFATGVPGIILWPPALGDADAQGRRPGDWQANMRPEDFLRVAQKTEELGYDYLGCPEHIIMPCDHLEVMGPRWNEAFTQMAFFAGATKRIRVISTILVLPYRHPVLLARALATLDFLCGGRVTLNIGAGWLQKESEILNVPYHERGAMTDEHILAMKEL